MSGWTRWGELKVGLKAEEGGVESGWFKGGVRDGSGEEMRR